MIGAYWRIAEGRQRFEIGGVALLDRVYPQQADAQRLQVVGHQHAATEDLRQQATVVTPQHRQGRMQTTDPQLALPGARLGGQRQLAVFIRHVALGIMRQNTRAGTVRAGIQLDPEGTERIDTEADAAFGESRLQVEYEALAPLVPLGLGSTLIAEIPVVIKVAQLEARLGVT